MKKYVIKGADQTATNADLRARFGATVTRQELFQYREETGIFPEWLQRDPALRAGRGCYHVPDSGISEDNVTAAPVVVRPVPKYAKKDKLADSKAEHAVLPTPFDDGAYDEPATEPVEPEDVPKKRGRAKKVEEPEVPEAPKTDRPADVFVHAWVCDDKKCVGRKPGTFYVTKPDGLLAPPMCECGSSMSRHSWAKKRKSFES